jgi:hypothetical protein
MKKSELKNIIKECVKEVIFEEGVLSGIITEVAQGLQGSLLTKETAAPTPSRRASSQRDVKNRILSEVGKNSYAEVKEKFSNPELFEGTQPIVEGNGQSALSGVAPDDSGVEISNIPGFGNWGAVAENLRK